MEWTKEAKTYFDNVPKFVQNSVKAKIQKKAQAEGVDLIDIKFLLDAKDSMMGGKKKSEFQKEENSRRNVGKANLVTSQIVEDYEKAFFAKENVDPLTGAFDNKTAVHAAMGGEKLVAQKDNQKIWNKISNIKREKDTTAYFHIPFCHNHCAYCGFYMNSTKKASSEKYTDALIKEIRLDSNKKAFTSFPIRAVYFGGGTPTVLKPNDIIRLLREIKKELPLSNDCEITIETTVNDLDDYMLEACIEGGANRFSIGVQTFDTFIRRSLGRKKEYKEVVKVLEKALKTNEAVIIIDLIYGLPGQNMSVWENDIENLVELKLDGADLYQLNIFKGSPLDVAYKKGKLPKPATIKEQARMFKMGVELMMANRFKRLSMNHWGRGTKERNIYNSFSLKGAETLGFGSGAGGVLSGYSYHMERNLDKYFSAIDENKKPISIMMAHSKTKPLANSIAGSFETGSLNFFEIKKEHNVDIGEIAKPLLKQWEKAGLIIIKDGWLDLTIAGEFWRVNLAKAVIDYTKIVLNE